MGKVGRKLARVERAQRQGTERQERFWGLACAATRAVLDGADGGPWGVELGRSWDPQADVAFQRGDGLLWMLVLRSSRAAGYADLACYADGVRWGVIARRHEAAFRLVAQAYTGREFDLRAAIMSAAFPEVLPPWLRLAAEFRSRAGVMQVPSGPAPRWLTNVVGPARALFLAGLVAPGEWVSIPRERVPAHPWALFVSAAEWAALHAAAPNGERGKRCKMPAVRHPFRWWFDGAVEARCTEAPGVPSEVAAELDQVVELLQAKREALEGNISPRAFAAMTKVSWLFEAPGHGGKTRVARALLAHGADVYTVAKLARADVANVGRLAREVNGQG